MTATLLRFALLLWLATLNALFGAFLVPLRYGTVPVPVSLVLATAGNATLGLLGGRLLGSRAGAALPGLVWLVVVLALGSPRPEGDLVIPADAVGVAFLVLGAVAAAAAYALTPPRGGASPRGRTRR